MNPLRPIVRAAAGLVVGSAIVLGASAAADAATPTNGSAQAIQASVQQLLDTLYGPGNATVRVAADVTTSSGQVVSTTYSTATGSPTFAQVTGANGTVSANALDSTTTSTAVPAGTIVRETIAVAVNSRAVPTANLTSLRGLVDAAAGVSAKRGDSVSLVALPFSTAAQTAATAAAAQNAAVQSHLASDRLTTTLVEVGGGVVALVLVLVAVTRLGKRRTSPTIPMRQDVLPVP